MRQLLLLAILMAGMATHAFSQNDDDSYTPLDGIVEKKLSNQRRVLPYPPIREADIMWEKKVWRVIDTREKINLHFQYPQKTFFDVLTQAIADNRMTAYAINDRDDFSEPLSKQEVDQMLYEVDTFTWFDPVTYEEKIEIAYNSIDPADIKRFRIKEVWYMDSRTSQLRVRIIGIAPLKEEYDDQGNFLYELPLFWVHYPSSREAFAQETVFNPGNDNAPMNWTDLFEMRYFASHIYKESNVQDRRLKDIPGLQGVDLLVESKKLNDQIFNYEHDLWEF